MNGSWTFDSACRKYAVFLGSGVLEDIAARCEAAGDLETGGILVGHYSEDRHTAVVTEATPPPSDSRRGRTWFVRGLAGLRDRLAAKWAAPNREYYLGEWHYHPAAEVEPSREDLEQLRAIAQARNYECREPLLLIAGRGFRAGVVRIFVSPAGVDVLELLRSEAASKQ